MEKIRTCYIRELRFRNTGLQASFHSSVDLKTIASILPGSVQCVWNVRADHQEKADLEYLLQPRRTVNQPREVQHAQEGNGKRNVTTRKTCTWAEPGSRHTHRNGHAYDRHNDRCQTECSRPFVGHSRGHKASRMRAPSDQHQMVSAAAIQYSLATGFAGRLRNSRLVLAPAPNPGHNGWYEGRT